LEQRIWWQADALQKIHNHPPLPAPTMQLSTAGGRTDTQPPWDRHNIWQQPPGHLRTDQVWAVFLSPENWGLGGRTCYPVTHVLQTGDNLNVKSSQILVKRRDKAIGHDYNKFHKPFQNIFENSTSST
jgi:hypothetical protein